MSEAAVARAETEPLIIGRYALFDLIASGGMATVHLGRLLGSAGFGRTVAVKRLHAQYAGDQDFVTMFMDEARIVARIRHPNVVPMVDVIESSKGLFLVMEYVHGESFSKLLRACRQTKEPVPISIVAAVAHGALLGLHAAHETTDANGMLLNVVHRDVSPQNIIVGVDGVSRMLDFGVAKAAGRAQVTREGQIKGKLAYMAPEQIRGQVDRRADIFAASVVLWEALVGRRLHEGAKDVEIVSRVVQGKFPRPSSLRSDIPPELDAIAMRGLEGDVEKRYQTANDMALELGRLVRLAPAAEVTEWVERLAANALSVRAKKIAAMEAISGDLSPSDSVPPPHAGDAEEVASPSSDPHISAPALEASEEQAVVLTAEDALPAPYLGDDAGTEFTEVMDDAPPLLTEAAGDAGEAATDVWPGQEPASVSDTPSGAALSVPDFYPPSPPVAPNSRRDLAPLIAIVSFCAALAVIGVVLGVWSLHARSAAGSGAPHPSTSAPRNTPPPPSSSATVTPSANPPEAPSGASPTGARSTTGAVSSPPALSGALANSMRRGPEPKGGEATRSRSAPAAAPK